MDKLLAQTPVEIMDLDGGRLLAMLSTHSPLKASLILAPGLKEHVIQHIGWPIMAVVPARDFLYLFPSDDRGGNKLASALGEVVVRENSNAAYPLSTEVFLIDDHGTAAIAEFRSH